MAVVTVRTPVVGSPSHLRRSNRAVGYENAKAFLAQVSGADDLVYRFPYAPVETSYESLSSEYEEIKRPNDYSYITRRAPQLARVTFEFRVADRPSRGAEPIIEDLSVLRAMAIDDVPVAIVGFGEFLYDGEARSLPLQTGQRSRSLFRIMEMGITVVQRSPENNEPTQADCRITLIEDRNPVFNIVELPKIVYEEEPPVQTENTKSGGNGGKSKKKNKSPAPTQSNTGGRNYSESPPPNNPTVIPGVGKRV
jgi:hypothetical protein